MSSAWCPTCSRWVDLTELRHDTETGLLHNVQPPPAAEASASVRVETVTADTWLPQPPSREDVPYQFVTPGTYVLATDRKTGELLARIRVHYAESPEGRPMVTEIASAVHRVVDLIYRMDEDGGKRELAVEDGSETPEGIKLLGYKFFDPHLGTDKPAIEIRVIFNPKEQNRHVLGWELERALRSTTSALAEANAPDDPLV